MAYEKQTWAKGDTITSAKLNHIEDGVSGAQGAVGPAGKDGEAGINGVDGKSAYQIWVDAGNTGAEADFIASLKGAKGDKGDAGAQGEKGDIGPTGEAGVSLTSAELETDADGKVTGGTLTGTDGKTIAITVKVVTA